MTQTHEKITFTADHAGNRDGVETATWGATWGGRRIGCLVMIRGGGPSALPPESVAWTFAMYKHASRELLKTTEVFVSGVLGEGDLRPTAFLATVILERLGFTYAAADAPLAVDPAPPRNSSAGPAAASPAFLAIGAPHVAETTARHAAGHGRVVLPARTHDADLAGHLTTSLE